MQLSKEKAKLTKAASGRAGSTKDSSSLGEAAAAPNEGKPSPATGDHETISGLPIANVNKEGELSGKRVDSDIFAY